MTPTRLYGSQVTLHVGQKQKTKVLGPVACAWAAKFSRRGQSEVNTSESKLGARVTEPPQITEKDMDFTVPRELMYGGQGKDSCLRNKEWASYMNSCDLVGDAIPRCNAATSMELAHHKPTRAILDGSKGELTASGSATTWDGLCQPRLQSNEVVLGHNKGIMCRENRQCQMAQKAVQPVVMPWTMHTGSKVPLPPTNHMDRPVHRNLLCPAGRALQHPAADILRKWSQFGCPTKTGRPWSKEEMWEAVKRGPHQSVLSLEAINHFMAETEEKIRTKQTWLIPRDSIKHDPPRELMISPIAAILHQLTAFCSILDFSFWLHLKNGGVLAAVNDTTKKLPQWEPSTKEETACPV
jgi:hypothetical protein